MSSRFPSRRCATGARISRCSSSISPVRRVPATGAKSPNFTPALERQLVGYDWPGNVRELRNIADRWVLGLWNGFAGADAVGADGFEGPLPGRIAAFERAVIEAEISKAGGKLKDVYTALGISRKGLYDKMRKHGISIGDADG
jgi:two-component system C4-dicarboxylate transport response regulator DctD